MLNESITPATVVGQACHSLIGSLWLRAIDAGFNKTRRDGSVQLLWHFIDKGIPVPNKHTAPFWLYACESAIDAVAGAREYTFVPPLSTPIQLDNIPDSGIDAFVHPDIEPVRESMRHHVGGELRKIMGRGIKHLDNYTPVARVSYGRMTISTQFDFQRDVADESDRLWQDRLKLGAHIGSVVKLPNCRNRLANIAGKHIEYLSTYGLFVRGAFEGHDRLWADGNPIAIGDGEAMTQLPMATMPVWFGFRIDSDGPPKALFDWCRAYAEHRDYAIECLANPSTYIGYPSFTAELQKMGVIHNPHTSPSQRGLADVQNAFSGLATFDLSKYGV